MARYYECVLGEQGMSVCRLGERNNTVCWGVIPLI